MTATKQRTKPQRAERKRGRRIRAMIFCDGKRWVFLPTKGMRLNHEASRPSAICDRAGLDFTRTWKRWRELFERPGFEWLRPYLFGAPRPAEPVKRKLIAPEMIRFRREGNRRAVSDSAKKNGDRIACGYQDVGRQIGLAAKVGTSEHAFIGDWVFRGGTGFDDSLDALPVRVVRPAEAAALLNGFDYVAIEGSSGDLNKRQSYREYLARKPESIPLATWVHFLFTAVEPPGWFVLTKVHHEVRRRAAFRRRCDSAGFNHTRIANLLRTDALQSLVRRAIDNPAAFPNEEKFQAQLEMQGLVNGAAAQLWRYVLKSRSGAILDEGGGSASWRTQTLEKAGRILGPAGRNLIETFITGGDIHTWRDPRACGEIAPRVLLPWPGLAEFQEGARSRLAGALRALASIAQDTSQACRDALLLRLTIPDTKLGRPAAGKGTTPAAPPGTAPLQATAPPTPAATSLEPLPEHNRRRKRGKKPDPKIAARNKRIVVAWQSRQYADFGKLGKEFDMTRGAVKNVIDRATRAPQKPAN